MRFKAFYSLVLLAACSTQLAFATDLEQFFGNYRLVAQEGRSFNQPKGYCPALLKVQYIKESILEGLLFEDVDGSFEGGNQFLSPAELRGGPMYASKRETVDVILAEHMITRNIRHKDGFESYRASDVFEVIATGLVIEQQLRALIGFTRVKCTYDRM